MKLHDPEYVNSFIGMRLRETRSAKRESLQAVGNAVGVTYQQMQKYENGTNRLSAANLYRVAQHFGVCVTTLLPTLATAESDHSAPSTDAEKFERLPQDVQEHIEGLIEAIAAGNVGSTIG
ncbi:helix-turn-helix transcriptional regulator [Aureimonas sp. ME7]|uniref:helix-turn-helix domain-containing protein n=1 Tax=Aureimonas sp. ME7 TaxID=2744252 RepID=UPI0015FB8CFE|nr:helix-turn-helix transcriptional regulator [Aureimonas sp. ME7]